MNTLNPDEQKIIERMMNDKVFRISTVRKSHYWFMHYYFGRDYVKYPTADFQREIFNLTENPKIQNLVITAFRGSAKSTIITLSYVIWSIVGEQQKKFPIILGHTREKAQSHLMAIKRELEHNELLRRDLGPFRQEDNQWGAQSLILPWYGAKISIGSVEQSIRGVRHNQHRPDVIIFDDVENMDSVRTQENRDKFFDWLTGDVLPAGDRNTKMIFIGTPLHNDSLLMRLGKIFEKENPRNVFRRYPIVDEDGKCLWPGKFPTQKDIDDEKAKCFSSLSWQREYLLKIVQSDSCIIKREHIHYYKELPPTSHSEYRIAATSIDPAHSQKPRADYTAMVSARVYGYGKNARIYILRNPVNAKLTTDQLISKAKSISLALGNGYATRVYVEEAALQGIITDLLKQHGIPAKPFHVRGQTKEGRLEAISSLIELGVILFPEEGTEKLIEQILGLGTGEKDDLVDAFTALILQLLEDTKREPSIRVITFRNDNRDDDNPSWVTGTNWKPWFPGQ